MKCYVCKQPIDKRGPHWILTGRKKGPVYFDGAWRKDVPFCDRCEAQEGWTKYWSQGKGCFTIMG